MSRAVRAVLVLALLASLPGCVSWCWCDDADANPANPGKDGRNSTFLAPGHAPLDSSARPG
jgi:hypothetical protein